MAKDIQDKKRKAAAPADEVAKVKKAKKVAPEVAEPAKKRKAAEEASPVSLKKSKTPKAEIASKPKAAKKSTTTKEITETKTEVTGVVPEKEKKTKTKPTSKKSKAPVDPTSSEEDEAEEKEDEAEVNEDADLEAASEDDDQTEAFLKGFESDEDEAPADAKPVEDVGEIPSINKKLKKQAKKAAEAAADEKPGVVYIGRIPHGFYENEMRAYFKQFGDIKNLRLARNRKTGASKHIAWIQFESSAVAEIVAKTMDNYLLFNHILKVKVVPDEQLPANLFKGANKRFKKVPWNKIAGRKLAQGASETTWNKRVEKENKRRESKADKLKAIGYEFEAPQLKSAVAMRKEMLLITADAEDEQVQEPKAIEAAPVEAPAPAVEEKNVKKKKSKTALVETPVEEVTVTEEKVVEAPAPVVEEKKVRKKKSKTTLVETPAEEVTVTEEKVVEAPAPAVEEKKVRKKKSKTTLVETPAEEVTATEAKVVEAPAPVVEEKMVRKKKSKATLVEPPVKEAKEEVKPLRKSKRKSVS
ncbi:hypothetical protein BP6252_12192 [Coleophoma cylindrospora]|uniref:RRM domain-containing protein n=1 Tax=Coleophoma cylindrospora TaxID=1849047 RepID=A0A3D8QGA4_9HELO|nr:hypothetical protein BP6252_12192 [Coleophoma cylindrospora]